MWTKDIFSIKFLQIVTIMNSPFINYITFFKMADGILWDIIFHG